MSRVAVLKGGGSLERQVSLRSGARVEDALQRLGHDVVGIDVGGDLVARLRAETPDFYSFTETAFKELGAAEALGDIEERLEFPIV